MRKDLFASIIIIFSLLPLYAESIEVSGEVSGVWDVDTVFVMGNLTIQNNDSLNITQGTIVEFQGDFVIVVYGSLNAAGAENDSILFTINDTTGFGDNTTTDGGWGGFRASSPDQSSSISFDYCIFKYFTRCLLLNNVICNNSSLYGGYFCEENNDLLVNCIIYGKETMSGDQISTNDTTAQYRFITPTSRMATMAKAI